MRFTVAGVAPTATAAAATADNVSLPLSFDVTFLAVRLVAGVDVAVDVAVATSVSVLLVAADFFDFLTGTRPAAFNGVLDDGVLIPSLSMVHLADESLPLVDDTFFDFFGAARPGV